jgi:dipeptidase E
MKGLLTSGGIANPTLRNALEKLLGKNINDASALCVPTAVYALSGGPRLAWSFVSGNAGAPMCELGWKSLGILELTALPSLEKETWMPMLEATDVLLVNGGDPLFLAYWMRQSGLDELLPTWNGVYVGMSAGSMVLTPDIGKEFVGWTKGDGSDRPLGLIPLSIFPHLNHPLLTENTTEAAKTWAKRLNNPAYAMDDQSALLVEHDQITVISEGTWISFPYGEEN